MAERISKLPDWNFQNGRLVTISAIRRNRLDTEWLGDESTGFSTKDLEERAKKREEVESAEGSIVIDASKMSIDELLKGF